MAIKKFEFTFNGKHYIIDLSKFLWDVVFKNKAIFTGQENHSGTEIHTGDVLMNNLSLNKPFYYYVKDVARDTPGDKRIVVNEGITKFQLCTGGGSSKGSGDWIKDEGVDF